MTLPPDAHVDPSAAELAERSRSFEAEALRWLADVARFARSLTRSPADADDLVQETYLRAFRSWRTYRPGADARRWLFAICRNAFLRTRERDDRTVALDGDPELETLAAVMLHVTAQRSGIDDLFDRLDVGPAIERAMAALPDAYRVAIALVDVEGYDYGDAAEELGIPVGTVRSRLYRGRRLLQEALLAHARDAGLAAARPPAPSTGPPTDRAHASRNPHD